MIGRKGEGHEAAEDEEPTEVLDDGSADGTKYDGTDSDDDGSSDFKHIIAPKS